MRYSAILLFTLTSAYAMQQPMRLPKIVVQGIPFPQLNPLENADVTRITAQDLERQQAVTLAVRGPR